MTDILVGLVGGVVVAAAWYLERQARARQTEVRIQLAQFETAVTAAVRSMAMASPGPAVTAPAPKPKKEKKEKAPETPAPTFMSRVMRTVHPDRPSRVPPEVEVVFMDYDELTVVGRQTMNPNRRTPILTLNDRVYKCVRGSVEEGSFIYRAEMPTEPSHV